ncbi:Zf-FLZ domain [Arabidopsis thaliana x Arabidopsis arenosa]|uniref:Zf-FLZ domain n=1 Tax=Arabidopsis thaliana x Arabidopsis arenosa TaxID=1240361 RepID=A0A8T2C2W5_9BRAS|nr:Zf-FLZ domain [Arabidopsis thaliana x Arabidopsis arenosa]
MLLSNPMTWKLSHMVVPGKNSIITSENVTASRTSPLDMKFPSPGSSKRYEDGGGIGLGIVAALEKSGIGIDTVCHTGAGSIGFDLARYSKRFQFAADIDQSDSEEYTCVTTRDGRTKVYYNEEEFEFGQNLSNGNQRSKKSIEIAEESPVKKREALRDSPNFLISCCLCKKKLRGKDIYMYKGDEGFCSRECRSVKIMDDSLVEQHKLRNAEVLSSPCAGDEIASPGIFLI